MSTAHTRRRTVAGIARTFGLLAVLVPAVSAQDGAAIVGTLVVGLVWAVTQVIEHRQVRGTFATELVSAGAVGLACAVTCAHSALGGSAMLGVLAIPPVTAAVQLGIRAGVFALAATMGVFITAVSLVGPMTVVLAAATFTWLLTGLGLGLIGGAAHAPLLGSDELAAHRSAQSLLQQLMSVSGRLGSPLDPEVLGTDLLNRLGSTLVGADLPVRGLALQAACDDGLVWVAGAPAAMAAHLAEGAVTTRQAVLAGDSFALPLTSQGRVIAVASGHLSPTAGRDDLSHQLGLIGAGLEDQVVVLETALLFTRFHNTATVAERRRLARELHDGIAQDLASVGYLLDAINGHPNPADQAQLVDDLRGFLSGVLGDLRRALVELRTDTGPGQSLGTALTEMARNVETLTGISFHVDVHEDGVRLRPEVEAELLRIGQEAITNAVRHSGARTIRVACTVAAPYAEVTVVDDGRGLGAARPDSHGLQIMRERARLIGAELELTGTGPAGGVCLSVRTCNDSARAGLSPAPAVRPTPSPVTPTGKVPA